MWWFFFLFIVGFFALFCTDWIGLSWIGLDWIGLDWIGLDCVVRVDKVDKVGEYITSD